MRIERYFLHVTILFWNNMNLFMLMNNSLKVDANENRSGRKVASLQNHWLVNYITHSFIYKQYMGGLYIYLQRAGTGGRGHEEEDSWARVAGHARLTSRRSLVARFTRNQLLGVRSVRFWVTDKITRILPTNNKSKANSRNFLIVKKSKKFSFCNSIKVFNITLLLLWILSSYLKSKIQT